MFEKSLDVFVKENEVNEEKTVVIFEITLSNLSAQGEIDEKDFMDRAKLLCSLGHVVMISNFKEYYKLVDYLAQYTKKQMALMYRGKQLCRDLRRTLLSRPRGRNTGSFWKNVLQQPKSVSLPNESR